MIYAMGKYHIDLSKVVMITEALHYKNAIGWYCVIETTERQFMIEHIFPDANMPQLVLIIFCAFIVIFSSAMVVNFFLWRRYRKFSNSVFKK